jgi:hypothetical protein
MCKECNWEDFLEEINDLQSDSNYDWAEETLSGIGETVGNWEHATEGQKAAVANIVAAVERKRG